MRIIASIVVSPVGESVSLSRYVKVAVKIIKESQLKYQVTPMCTIVEAEEIEEIFAVVKKIKEHMFKMNAKRVVLTLKIDERRDKVRAMEEKVSKVID